MSETNEGKFREGARLTRTDSRGRTLEIQQLSLRQEMDLIASAGAANAENRRWMMYATMVACVRSIDGVPQPAPSKARELNAAIEIVGAEGVAVVAATIAAETPVDEDGEPEDGSADAASTAKN